MLQRGGRYQRVGDVELRDTADPSCRFRDGAVHRELPDPIQRASKTGLIRVATGKELATSHDRDLPRGVDKVEAAKPT